MAHVIPDVSLIDNSDERQLVVLVLDRSESMEESGAMDALNSALKDLETDLKSDPIVAKRGRLLVITFGGDREVTVGHWTDVMDWEAPVLVANGNTPMCDAVTAALQAIEAQKNELRNNAISYKRPIMMLMTDGMPTDEDAMVEQVAQSCRDAESSKKVTIYPIAIGPVGSDHKSVLDGFSLKKAVTLNKLKFKELFVWLSRSVRSLSRAAKGEVTQIPSTESWTAVDTSTE